jgi:hypothetical protein
VNLLLNFRTFIVVLGIDARIITGAIEKHYEGLLGRAGASGYEYLDKIVQIPFRIPEPGPDDVVEFIAAQLGRPEEPDPGDDTQASLRFPPPSSPRLEVARRNAPSRATQQGLLNDSAAADPASSRGGEVVPEAGVAFTYRERMAFETFAPYLRPNPRHLKRLVNVYRLVRALARMRGERLLLEQPAATIRWLVMWAQWPYTSLKVMERFEQMLDEWNDTIPANAPPGDPVLHLLDDIATALDPTNLSRLDDDAAALLSSWP